MGLPFVYRGFLPGLIAWGLIGYVLLPQLGYHFVSLPLDAQAALVAIVPSTIGAGLVSLDYVIFTFYEGRFYWPRWLRNLLTERLQNKVKFWFDRQANVPDTGEEYKELWFKLRNFPEEGKRRVANCPTIMGNMLRQAEDYPWNRYRMDNEFYWYRLKMVVPKEKWDLVENTKAQVDFLVYSSFFLMAYSPVHIIIYVLAGKPIEALFGALTITTAYLLYRVSLKGLRLYLEEFKSIFDVYREDLRKAFDPNKLGQREQDFWRGSWETLQYGKELQGAEAQFLITVASNKDPALVANDVGKAGLNMDIVTGRSDFALSGYFRASTQAEINAKLDAIRRVDGVQNVSYFWKGV